MIRAQKIRLHPTPEQTNYFARAAPNQSLCVELGPGRMEPAIRDGREPHRTPAQKTVQPDQARAVSLDLGGHEKCFRSAISGSGESLHRLFRRPRPPPEVQEQE